MSDTLYYYQTIPHRSGKTANGMNMAWGAGHAGVNTTKAGLDATLWNAGNTASAPGNNNTTFHKILQALQPGSRFNHIVPAVDITLRSIVVFSAHENSLHLNRPVLLFAAIAFRENLNATRTAGRWPAEN